jgi:para-nitrobenzyl esterase
MKLDWEKRIADECCYIVVDGDVIPEDLDKAFEDAAKSGVQLMVGSNNDEWNYFKEDSEGETETEKFNAWVTEMEDMYKEAYEGADEKGKAALEELIRYEESIVPEEYAGDAKVKAALAKSGFVSETWRYEILDFADRLADAGGDVRTYLWKVRSTRDDMYKSAVHAVELAYVFNNLDQTIYTGENIDPNLAANVQAMWVNFAKTGNPSTKDLEWIKYDPIQRETMMLDSTCRMEKNPKALQRELLSPINKYYLNGNYHNISLNVPIIYRYALSTTILLGILVLLRMAIRKWRKRSRRPNEEEVIYDTLVRGYKTN